MREKEDIAVVHGSGNVFRDLGRIHADTDQFKAILATEIIKTLDRERLTVRRAQARTGIAAADFLAFAMPILDASRLTGSSRCSTVSGLVLR